jgi:uroporphyrinogen-III synthase
MRDLESTLAAGGIKAERIAVYRTVPAPYGSAKLDLSAVGIDTVILASPTAATGLLNQAIVSRDTRIVTIGPTTSDAVRSKGFVVAAQAAHPSEDAIIEALQ